MDNVTYTPPNFDNLPESTSETKRDAFKLALGEKIDRSLDDIHTIEYSLIKPIPYTLEYEDKCFILVQEDLNIGEEATSFKEAENLLASSIIKLYKKLSDYPSDKLGPYPKKLLAYLKDYIR